jgi:hypothetical protein
VDGPVSDASVIALRCRTSDRTPAACAGSSARRRGWAAARRRAADDRLARRAAGGDFAADLRDSRGCLLEAGGQVDDAMTDGRFPVLLASDCSICITTLPTVLRHQPAGADRLARRARRLQHARDDAERLPRRHVPGRRVRALGRWARRRCARPRRAW